MNTAANISRIPMRNSQEFRTNDMYLGAAILSEGHKLTRTERDGRRVYFIFEGNGEVRQIADKFFGDELYINARQFTKSWKALRQLL